MSDAVLLTGGTGFLGLAFLARLLEQDEGPEVFLAVRAEDAEEADGRVAKLLSQLYEDPPASASRLHPVCAELTASGLGLAADDRQTISANVNRVVHCAASVEFTLPLDEAREINVEGTRRVLEVAGELKGLERMVHVSTAYVCGREPDRFDEDDEISGEGFRNTYEQTKWEGELAVAEAEDIPCVTVRPSVVVGESGSGWTSSFNVIYWPLQAFARGMFTEVAADPEGLIDMVPVDYVAEVMERALLEPGIEGAFHAVAGERALTVAEVIDQTCRVFEREPPKLTPIGTLPDDHPATVFAPYFDVHTVFGDKRARSLVANGAPPAAENYMPGLLDYGLQTRWGKAPMSREAARARTATSVSQG